MLVKLTTSNIKLTLNKIEKERIKLLKVIEEQLEKDNKHLKFSFITIGNEK